MFLDSNIVLYALGTDRRKRQIARALLAEWPTVSTQVINECSHVLRRKLRLAPADVREQLGALIKTVHLSDVGMREIYAAWRLPNATATAILIV